MSVQKCHNCVGLTKLVTDQYEKLTKIETKMDNLGERNWTVEYKCNNIEIGIKAVLDEMGRMEARIVETGDQSNLKDKLTHAQTSVDRIIETIEDLNTRQKEINADVKEGNITSKRIERMTLDASARNLAEIFRDNMGKKNIEVKVQSQCTKEEINPLLKVVKEVKEEKIEKYVSSIMSGQVNNHIKESPSTASKLSTTSCQIKKEETSESSYLQKNVFNNINGNPYDFSEGSENDDEFGNVDFESLGDEDFDDNYDEEEDDYEDNADIFSFNDKKTSNTFGNAHKTVNNNESMSTVKDEIKEIVSTENVKTSIKQEMPLRDVSIYDERARLSIINPFAMIGLK